MLRYLFGVLFFVLMLVAADGLFVSSATAAGRMVASTTQMRAAERQAIRQTPLLMRPNRPGHFYGNTVRRLHYGR